MLTLASWRRMHLAGAICGPWARPPLSLLQVAAGHGEGEVGDLLHAGVLDDGVHADAGLGQRLEDGGGDAGPVGHPANGYLGHVQVVGDAAHLVALLSI